MEPTDSQVIPQKQNPFIVPFSIVVAGLLIGAGIYMSGKNPESGRVAGNIENTDTIEEIAVNPVNAKDHILGNPNADVVIIEFSDTECPFCKTFHQTMKRIMNDYGKDGRVAWVYRHFPIDGLHKFARNEAHATECVAELGGNTKFWEFIDLIFAKTSSSDGLPPENLPKMAEEIGIDRKKFDECQTSNKYANIIIQDEQDAQRSGGRGTPHSVLVTRTGEKVAIKGAQPYDVMKSVIDAALSTMPAR